LAFAFGIGPLVQFFLGVFDPTGRLERRAIDLDAAPGAAE
jgi:hypothetical protein